MARLYCTLLMPDGTRRERLVYQTISPAALAATFIRLKGRRVFALAQFRPLGTSRRRVSWHWEYPVPHHSAYVI